MNDQMMSLRFLIFEWFCGWRDVFMWCNSE